MQNPVPPDFCFLAIHHWSTCMQKSEWANWVQAVGSVVAILAAGILVFVQDRMNRRTARIALQQDRHRRLAVVLHLIGTGQGVCVRAQLNAESRFDEWDSVVLPMVNEAIASIDAVPLMDFPDATSIVQVSAVRHELVELQGFVKQLALGGGLPDDRAARLITHCEKYRATCRAAAEVCTLMRDDAIAKGG